MVHPMFGQVMTSPYDVAEGAKYMHDVRVS